MKNYFTILFLIIATLATAQEKGTLQGKILDKEANNEPLPFANVFVKGTQSGTTTDMDGVYLFKANAGTYTLVVSFVGYETVEIPNVIVKAGEVTTLDNIVLGPNQGVALKEVIVKATTKKESVAALLTDQKKAVEIKTTIGAQELSAKGVGDVATAVTKATGVSKQEGSGSVFVRGLGDRYNSTTLNGLPLPSNNPSKKNINLDIFSTDIVEFIDINKIYNNKIYGDFGGANVNIINKRHTGKPSLELGLGFGLNENAIKQDNFALQEGPNFSGFYSDSYPNNPLSGYNFENSFDKTNKKNTPFNNDLSINGGFSKNFGENSRLSFFGTASFSNGYKYREGIQRGNVNTQGLVYTDYTYESSGYETNTTLMGNLVYRINENHKLFYTPLFINSSNQTLNDYSGTINVFDNAENGGGFIRRSTFDRTKFLVNQLLGEHKLTDQIDLNWGVSYNNVNNIVPDRRQVMLVPQDNNDPNGLRIASSLATSDNHRFYQDLLENEASANIYATYKFNKNEDDEFLGRLTLGYSGRFKSVDFEATQFNLGVNRNITQPIVDINNLDAYFNQNNINNNYFEISTFRGGVSVPNALAPQTFGGNQNINAVFGSAQYKFGESLTASLGVRTEQIFQDVEWNTSLGTGNNDFDEVKFLPNLSIKYELNDKQNLKLAASQSYTLPQFKERAPFQFEEVGQTKFGNADLYPSTNYNFDLRWEFFPKSGEVISLTGFYKNIVDPINEVIVASATNDISYVNTGDNASILGLEVEIRKDLFNFEGDFKNKLSGGLNFSYINSNQDFNRNKVANETRLTVNFTNNEGRITGASDILLNADLTYLKEFNENSNIQTTLSFNYFSDRVYAIGSAGKGDLIDEAVNTLDFIFKYKLSKRVKLGMSVKNILNPKIERYQETQNVIVSSYKKGINGGISLGIKLD